MKSQYVTALMKAVLFDLYETLYPSIGLTGAPGCGVLAWASPRTVSPANGGRGMTGGCEGSFLTTIPWFGTFARRRG